ncbi:MAG: hypothetical protein V1721_05285 [Pseudomonadota bacterium]
MLAGAQVIDAVIGAGAVIHPRRLAANCNFVSLPRFRIGQGVLGKKSVAADIFQDEALLLAELPAQGALPILQRDVVRFVVGRSSAVVWLFFPFGRLSTSILPSKTDGSESVAGRQILNTERGWIQLTIVNGPLSSAFFLSPPSLFLTHKRHFHILG